MYGERVRALVNGRVFTGRDWAQGVVIRDDGAIAAVLRSATGLVDMPTRDLQGAMVVPGFIDAHVHLSHMAEARRGLPIRGSESAEELLALVGRRASEVPSGSWILGSGYNDTTWRPAAMDRWMLDAVSHGHPVFLERKDLHSGMANSLALQAAGIVEAARDPPGGRYERDADGRLTGVMRERALEALDRVVPAMPVAELAARLEVTCGDLLGLGITTVCTIGDEREVEALETLEREGRLPLRVCQYVMGGALDRLQTTKVRTQIRNGRYWLAGTKLFADGSLGSRTAWLEKPYVGTDDTGVPVMEPGELTAAVETARRARLGVAIHAIGDRALRVALDALEATAARDWPSGFPDRIEHVQLGSPALFRRMRELGVIASMQPVHAPADRVLADRWWGSRCRYAYAWRSVLDAGVALAFGSDAPVESADPIQGLFAACARRDAEGEPPLGWYPEQRLSLEEALGAYTVGAARAIGRPALGTLAVGCWADLVVLDGDPAAGTASVVESYVAGQPVTSA